jgi:SAM-dependent methyltransferase
MDAAESTNTTSSMKQVTSAHYCTPEYLSKPRFFSYWNQVTEVIRLDPSSVLEIGPGPGIVTGILRTLGYKVTTLDFADDVGANVVASVLEMPFGNSEFDVTICCQVLEHIEFSKFECALEEIKRVTKIGAIISLPHAGKFWAYQLHIPKIGPITFGFNVQLKAEDHLFDGQHYWEIGKINYPITKIRAIFGKVFKHSKDFRPPENPYHHFFITRTQVNNT